MRITDLKFSITQYKNDINMFEDRIKDFDWLKNHILKKRIGQNSKNMKFNRVKCDICKTDIHKVWYNGFFKI